MTTRRNFFRSPLFPFFVAIAAGVPVALWWTAEEVVDAQKRNLNTLIVTGAALLLLLLWTCLLSPLPRRARGGIAAAVLLLALLFRLEGTSGDLVPILRLRGTGAAAPAAVAATSDVAKAVDFPRFLGSTRDGVLAGPALERDWAARPPKLLWKREVGAAWSGFAVAGRKALTQEQQGPDEGVTACDLATGRPLWRHADPVRYDTTLGGAGPRATPTVEGGRVYTLGATGILNCLDLETGKRIWSADIARDAGAEVPPWGYAGSPLLEGGRVIVQPAGPAAYDAATGRRVWAAGSESPGYASPTLAVLAGRRQVVMLNQRSCAGHDPETGGILWRHEWRGEQPKAAQPLAVGDDRLVISAGYAVGADAFRVAGDRVETLWTSKRLKSKFATFVLRDGHLFGLDDGRLACLRVGDGERAWSGSWYGHGQLLLAGDVLLVSAEAGFIALVDADPAGFRERARLQVLEGKMWNPPALAGPYLLVRTDREAACLELPTER